MTLTTEPGTKNQEPRQRIKDKGQFSANLKFPAFPHVHTSYFIAHSSYLILLTSYLILITISRKQQTLFRVSR